MDLLLGLAGNHVPGNSCLLLAGLPGSWSARAGLSVLRVDCGRQTLATLEDPGILVKSGGITGHHKGEIAIDQIVEREIDFPVVPDEVVAEPGGHISFKKRFQGFICPWDLKEIDAVFQSFSTNEVFPDCVEFSPCIGLVLYEVEERIAVG